jgi:hypothetical protein
MRELQAGSTRKTESSRQHNFKHENFWFSIMFPGNENLRVSPDQSTPFVEHIPVIRSSNEVA